jgi:hypothetical protein
LKRGLAARYKGLDADAREHYARAKSDFVEQVIVLALRSEHAN